MSNRVSVFISLFFLLLGSCKSGALDITETMTIDPASTYGYEIGLGYGFLGKEVHVRVNGEEVLSVVGTEDIEEFAQLLGTKMLVSGTSPKEEVQITVTVDDRKPFQQAIDLSTGGFIHIYYDETGLRIFNTRVLELE